jgi:hypothetical protein
VQRRYEFAMIEKSAIHSLFLSSSSVLSSPVGLQLEPSIMDTSEPVQARRRRTASASASVAAEATALSVDIGLLLNSQGRRHHRSWGIYPPPLLRQLGARGGTKFLVLDA